MKKLPKFLQPILWSYPIEHLDTKKDAQYIITQLLNHGNWETVKWLKSTYGDNKIKAIIKNPRRGLWHEKVFNFWEQMYGIKIDPELRKRAIMDINPDPNYKLPS